MFSVKNKKQIKKMINDKYIFIVSFVFILFLDYIIKNNAYVITLLFIIKLAILINLLLFLFFNEKKSPGLKTKLLN